MVLENIDWSCEPSVPNSDTSPSNTHACSARVYFATITPYFKRRFCEWMFHVASTEAFRLREHFGFQDLQDNELAAILEKIMHIKDTYSIYRKGNVLATIKKTLITPLRQRFDVHVAGGENMEVEGNILDYEYEIHEGRKRVAEVSKKWFRIADTYGVDIIAAADDVLILAITVVIDMMIDGGK
jgi:uncharacterized protein YxjI